MLQIFSRRAFGISRCDFNNFRCAYLVGDVLFNSLYLWIKAAIKSSRIAQLSATSARGFLGVALDPDVVGSSDVTAVAGSEIGVAS